MKQILKGLIFIWGLLFTTLLYADGTDVTITVTDASAVYESNGPLKFTIELSEAPWISTVTVNYTTADGTAKAGEDYNSTTGSVTFYPFQSTKTIEVPIINNDIYEASEFLYLNISNSTNGYVVTDSRGVGYIHDDDIAPLKAKIYDRYERERDNNWILNFTVGLNQDAPNDITLNYTTIDSSAISGDDYMESNGTLTIPKGSKYGYIPITIVADTIPEGTEHFDIKISSISEGSIDRDTAIGTIVDDDAIKVYMDSENVTEGNSGDSNKMPFRVYLGKEYPLDSPLTIHYETQDGSSSPSASSSSDYVSKTGDITFNKGDKEIIIYVDIVGDNEIEENEYLQMNLSGSTSIKTSSSESLILNDDGEYPSISFSSTEYSIVEGNSSQKNLDFTFTLNTPALDGSSFYYKTSNNTAQNENGDNDYIYTHGNKALDEGTTSFTISVPINGDTKIEEDESFYFSFSDLEKLNYGTTDRAKGVILNDDGEYPTLSFTKSSFSIEEGDSGQRDINFTLSLDLPALEGSHFDYYTKDNSASSGEDFVAISRTTYNIPTGEQNITIPIRINGDTTIEDDEDFYLLIDNESENLKITGTQSPTGTIINDDGSFPQIDIEKESYTTVEGNDTSHTIEIKLTLDKPALVDTTIEYYTQDKDAQDGSTSTEDNDYIANRGTIDIEENSTSAIIELTVNGDTNIEPNEDFRLYLRDGENLTIGRDKTTITIINDDIHTQEPFECDEHMYLSSSIKRGSEVTGKMWLHRIDTIKSPFGFEVLDDEGDVKLYNALAYNEKDNYIYGLYYKELFKISKTGKVMSLGDVSRLPELLENKQAYAGASYNGYYYVTGFGVDYDKIYKIKLSDSDDERTVEEINLTIAVSIKDFSFSSKGEYLYGIADGGKLTKIDVSSGEVSFIGDSHDGYEFDSSFSDKNGRFFANDSNGNGFFEFNLEDGTKRFLSDSQPADYNDGANCINSSLVFTDYGDAPMRYENTWHNISNGIYLGDKIDHDIGSYDTENADGDDINGLDDDDGVTLLDGTDINGTYFEAGTTHQLKVKLSKEAYLKIWIDTKINGTFDNGDDLVYNSGVKLSAGVHTISFTLPANLPENIKTYLRARVSSYPSMNPTGFVLDGEVEDYMIKFGVGVQPLRGKFNIERIDSKNYLVGTDRRNAWYTQIAGLDFDYSLVFYNNDFTSEQTISNVTAKIELFDNIKNSAIYERYIHIPASSTDSRFDFDDSNSPIDDLSEQSSSSFPPIPASRNVIFRVTYPIDKDGNIIQSDCESLPKECFDNFTHTKTELARDNFAIRPDNFYISIFDNNIEGATSSPLKHSLSMASGYDYNLTIVASRYLTSTPTMGYDKSITSQFDFNSTAGIDTNTSPIVKSISFNNGLFNDLNFTHQNVGRYILKIPNDTNWSGVDQNSSVEQCIANSGERVPNEMGLIGCSIVTYKFPIEMTFFPHHFDIDLNITNLPKSTHDDFVYMSEVNSTYANTAIAFQGKILPKSKDGNITTNFTASCISQDTNLSIDLTSLSDRGGANIAIKTARGNPLYFVRALRYNNDSNFTITKDNVLSNLLLVTLNKEQFLDTNGGSIPLDIRFNIDKNSTEPTNPIQITFNKLDIISPTSSSFAEGQSNYIPIGTKDINRRKNFYYARVVSALPIYPRVNMNISPVIKTPLYVDLYCQTAIPDYCIDTNIISNSRVTGTTREQNGWYISVKHNGDVDGNVTGLHDNPNILDSRENFVNVEDGNITLNGGSNHLTDAKVNDCSVFQSTTVTIITTPELKFEPSQYIIECTENNASQWTGIGKTGNILDIKPKIGETGKMDW